MRKTNLLLLLFLLFFTATISACFYSPKPGLVLPQTESVSQNIDNISRTISQSESQSESKVSVSKMTKISFVAFGDSIARGAELLNPETDCYPVIVSTKLKALQGIEQVLYQNYAINGQTSSQLLEQLKTKGDEIESSDIITISTGANNVLGVFLGEAAKIFNKYGFSLSDTNNAGSIFNDVFSGSVDPELYQKLLLIFSELNSYIESEEFDVQIATATAQLKSDLPKIVAEIRSKNQDAVIVLNTIYNPYKHLAITMGNISLFSPSEQTEKAVMALNKVIIEQSQRLGYVIVPVYEKFSAYIGNKRLENAFFSFEALSSTNIDVHPSKAGHELIAEIVLETIKPIIQ